MGGKLSYPEVDLAGKVVLITGGNTGIGYETAKGLARLGAHTFIACRSKERAEDAIRRMKEELTPKPQEEKIEGASSEREGDVQGTSEASQEPFKVEYIALDLSSFQSTIDCVRVFKERNLPLHILINNAALCAVPYTRTNDGFESQFQVNHLSHMLLTLELLPLVLDTAASTGDGRIIFVSSYGHYLAQAFNANTLNREERDYSRLSMYNNTKLYNVLTSYALQRRIPADKNVTVSSVHPGYVETDLSRGFQDHKLGYYFQRFTVKAIGRKPVTGAATTLNCAVNPSLNSKQHFYYDSCRPKQPSTDARNEVFQEQLWTKSFEFFKEYLSPETIEAYGPKAEPSGNQDLPTESSTSAVVVNPGDAASNQGTKEEPITGDTPQRNKEAEEKPSDVTAESADDVKPSTEDTSENKKEAEKEAEKPSDITAESADDVKPSTEDTSESNKEAEKEAEKPSDVTAESADDVEGKPSTEDTSESNKDTAVTVESAGDAGSQAD